MFDPASSTPGFSHGSERRRLAQRVADAHRGLDDSSLLAFVSGSVAEGMADERSNVNMSLVWAELPPRADLEAAGARAGGGPWLWMQGDWDAGQAMVAFVADGIEVLLTYATQAWLHGQLDELLVRHQPDTPAHLLADGVLKAEPLFGHRPLRALQDRLAAFPPHLARAMARHYAAHPTPWAVLQQLQHRDAPLACRELQVQACHRLLGLLSALNGRYHSPARNKRLRHLAAGLELAPPGLADRIDALLAAPPRAAARALHALEGEVLSLLESRFPDLDLAPWRDARQRFAAG